MDTIFHSLLRCGKKKEIMPCGTDHVDVLPAPLASAGGAEIGITGDVGSGAGRGIACHGTEPGNKLDYTKGGGLP